MIAENKVATYKINGGMENEETRNMRNWRYRELLTIVDTWVLGYSREIRSIGLQTTISPSSA